ncbi:MAG: glycoside hydrolase family 127 protein [Anaerolineaceae bacterium]|nr:glycoside hydrolase family 127 protein [Anaerolineaceae bacterium]
MKVTYYGKFTEVPMASVTPEGWLHRYLINQRNGLTGHLEAAGYPFNTAGWAVDEIPNLSDGNFWLPWWPYEQTGYWMDGMLRCGYLLRDKFLIQKGMKSVEHVLDGQDADGYMGPPFLKERGEFWARWPHAVFFRALMAYHSASGDERVVEAFHRHYLSGTYDHNEGRDLANLEQILWTYERTGDEALLAQAEANYEHFNQTNTVRHFTFRVLGIPFKRKINRAFLHDVKLEGMLTDEPGSEHGVTYNELCKQAAILYLYTGNETYREAAVKAYEKIDKYHMLVDGIHSSTEGLKGKDPLDSHETCDIADYTWSLYYMLRATGDATYADRIERACFNALPGAVTRDFKGLQYFSCPNQVIADKHSNHNLFMRGKEWMSYRPKPGTECCSGNVHRVMPNFAANVWMSDGAGGLVAALYAPGRVTLPLGAHGKPVTVIEETQYPFSERIDFEIHAEEAVSFALHLRIPEWCSSASLMVNGKDAGLELPAGTFVKLERSFAPYDVITLNLPMRLRVGHWLHGGISVERGPLVYSLGIYEDWQVDRDDKNQTADFPAWNLYPASDWNYALAIDPAQPEKDIEILYRPVTPEPWDLDSAPIELRVPARKVRDWKIVETNVVERTPGKGILGIPLGWEHPSKVRGHFRLTPQLPDPAGLAERLEEEVEMLRLVPYGCTRLRVTIFPAAKIEIN